MALSWLGRRIELNRAAVIGGSMALGLMLAGLVILWKTEEAHDDNARRNLGALARQNAAAIDRLVALEQPSGGNIKALIVRFLKQRARARARSPLESRAPGAHGRRPSSGTSPPSSSPAPRTPPRGPAGGTGAPGPAGPPGPAAPSPPAPPSSPSPLEPLEDLLDRLPLP